MPDQSFTVASLRSLIGLEVYYNGRPCQIIEILEDGPHVILQHKDLHPSIQPDQHGEAHRMVPTTVTLPVMDGDGHALSSDFHNLNVGHLL